MPPVIKAWFKVCYYLIQSYLTVSHHTLPPSLRCINPLATNAKALAKWHWCCFRIMPRVSPCAQNPVATSLSPSDLTLYYFVGCSRAMRIATFFVVIIVVGLVHR